MWGAIAGDIIGSAYEFQRPPIKTPDFGAIFHRRCEFTDDTIMTIATADALLKQHLAHPETQSDYGQYYWQWGNRYPSSYGGMFAKWLATKNPKPYNSLGNGSAMRVSPVGWAFDDVDLVLSEAKRSAEVTHNHIEGIKGAQSVALAVLMARQGATKSDIRGELESRFKYNLQRTLDEIRLDYSFDETCPGSVPESIIAFLESTDFESSVRGAISLGGDTDTQACIAGSIAHAFYGRLDSHIMDATRSYLPDEMLDIADRFCECYGID